MKSSDTNRSSDDPSTGTERREPTRHPDPNHQHPPADNRRETGIESSETDEQQDKVRRSNLAGDQDLPGGPTAN